MSPEESARILAALAFVVTVYATALLLAVRLVVLRVRGVQRSRRDVLVTRAVFGLAGAGVLCIAYARVIEPYWLDVAHVRTESKRWRGEPLRIVHLSDLHCDPVARLEERLPDAARAARPDVIVFTGDALNSPDGLPVFRRLMRELSAIAPTVAVRGNWDVWYWSKLELFDGTDAREVANSAVVLSVRGQQVWIGGLTVGREAALPALMASAPSDALRVLLHHYPDEVLNAAGEGADLYLAGHTHGGQVALPFYGALATLSRFGKRFESGLYRIGDMSAYVSRGVGMEGGAAPRVRFFARPELAVLEVHATR